MMTRVENNKKQRQEITKEVNQKRFKKIFKTISLTLLIFTSILLYGMFIGAKVLKVNEIKIINNQIPSSFHGVKVVHFSDLLYDSFKEKDLENLKEKINDLEADILVFTGDIKKLNYNLSKDDINILEKFFKELESSIKKYAVIGDNDNEYFKVIMENSDFLVLNNESDLVFFKEITPIKVIGFDTTNLNLDNLKNEEYFSICMLHNPDKINNLKDIKCDLALAGDTLGGEIKITPNSCLLTDNKYCKSYYDINNTKLYISNGIGNNYKIRLFNRPSINLYRLRKY